MREPTTTAAAAAPAVPTVAAALAPVASLGLILAACPACRLPLGLDGAPGLAQVLTVHSRGCPKRRPGYDVCPWCGCEAELIWCASGWRCGDCLAETRLTDPAIPAAMAAARPNVRRPVHATPADPAQDLAHTPRRRRPAQRAAVA